MTVSVDGKVSGDFLGSPAGQRAAQAYYDIHREFRAEAFACGRITMEGSFTAGWTPDLTPFAEVHVPREDWLGEPGAGFFAVSFDRRGRLGWRSGRIADEDPGYGGAHVVEVLCEDTPDPRLAWLRSAGVSCLFAGERELDLALALEKLWDRLAIRTLLLEGGSILNGAFLRAGLVDELSLVVAPVLAEGKGAPLFQEGILQQCTLKECCSLGDGLLWLRYDVEQTAAG